VMTTAIGQYAKVSGLEGQWRVWLECKLLEGAIGEELGVLFGETRQSSFGPGELSSHRHYPNSRPFRL
jgi:hypothetical protein